MDIFKVGAEVVVVFIQSTGDREEVEVTLEEVAMVGLLNLFPVRKGEDLSKMEQIHKMSVAIIARAMAG